MAESVEDKDKTEEAVKDCEEVEAAEKANENGVEETSKVRERVDTSGNNDDSDTIAEKASTSINKMMIKMTVTVIFMFLDIGTI